VDCAEGESAACPAPAGLAFRLLVKKRGEFEVYEYLDPGVAAEPCWSGLRSGAHAQPGWKRDRHCQH